MGESARYTSSTALFMDTDDNRFNLQCPRTEELVKTNEELRSKQSAGKHFRDLAYKALMATNQELQQAAEAEDSDGEDEGAYGEKLDDDNVVGKILKLKGHKGTTVDRAPKMAMLMDMLGGIKTKQPIRQSIMNEGGGYAISECMSNTPRLSATMSPEAIYCTLKCYEDMLLKRIESDCKRDVGHVLYRVKSPTKRIDSVVVVDAHRTPMVRPSSQLLVGAIRSKQSVNVMNANDSEEEQPQKELPQLSLIRQREMSVKVQRAMDILDSMTYKTNGTVTSSRRQAYTAIHDTMSAYNRWSQQWKKEFQFRTRRKVDKSKKKARGKKEFYLGMDTIAEAL